MAANMGKKLVSTSPGRCDKPGLMLVWIIIGVAALVAVTLDYSKRDNRDEPLRGGKLAVHVGAMILSVTAAFAIALIITYE
ncbi:MAG: hypothetical protein WAL22_18070 [Solirubrobacteraceae bacterium]